MKRRLLALVAALAVMEADDRFSRIRWFPKGGIARDVAPATGPFDA
jgi:hypothetical protein